MILDPVACAIDQCLMTLAPRPSVPPSVRVAVALSGGLDSMVLTHVLASRARHAALPVQVVLYALHVHHGLSPHATQWQLFCQEHAQALGFIFVTREVKVALHSDGGIEQAARDARYDALRGMCDAHHIDYVLSAHHQDDQAETVLLQLLRGAGLAGLAAMPTSTRRYTNGQGVIKPDGGWLLRPFLSLSRAQLHHYAVQHNIAHIEDPSNNDCAYDRNALRHQVMPHLAAIRPGYQKTLARSAALLAEANELLDALAEIDLASDVTIAQGSIGPRANRRLTSQKVSDEIGLDEQGCTQNVTPVQALPAALPVASVLNRLSCTLLKQLSNARARNVLRYWLKSHGLRLPNAGHLAQMLKQFCSTRIDAHTQIRHDQRVLRVWREQVWLEPIKRLSHIATPCVFTWQGQEHIELPQWGGSLLFLPSRERDTDMAVPLSVLRTHAVHVLGRCAGVRFRAHPKRCSRSLGDAYQEQGVPPWLRDGPFIYVGDVLIFAAYLGVNYAQRALSWVSAMTSDTYSSGNECVYLRWQFSDDE